MKYTLNTHAHAAFLAKLGVAIPNMDPAELKKHMDKARERSAKISGASPEPAPSPEPVPSPPSRDSSG